MDDYVLAVGVNVPYGSCAAEFGDRGDRPDRAQVDKASAGLLASARRIHAAHPKDP